MKHFPQIIILTILPLLFAASCIKYDADADLVQNIVNSKLEIGKDISISESENINLLQPRIYFKDDRYYFGNFYYLYDNRVYYIDAENANINVSHNERISTIFTDYNDIANAKIMNVDTDSLYITHLSSVYLPNDIITNISIIEESPDLNEAGSEVIFITNVTLQTNFTQSNVVSLTKMLKKGDIAFTLTNILDESTTILKIISTDDNFYIVYRKNAIVMLDEYSLGGEYIETYSLDNMEVYDNRNKDYTRIIDVSYIKDRDKMAVLTESLSGVRIMSRKIWFTDDFKTFDETIEIIDINDNQVISLSSSGLLIALHFGTDEYTLLKYDIYTRKRWVSYIDSGDIANIGSFDIFDNDIATFSIDDNNILFYKY